jgi:hypothetical protein
MRLVAAHEVMNERYMRENEIKPTRAVRIPYTDCCDRMPWDCECKKSCVDCRSIRGGQGGCGCEE